MTCVWPACVSISLQTSRILVYPAGHDGAGTGFDARVHRTGHKDGHDGHLLAADPSQDRRADRVLLYEAVYGERVASGNRRGGARGWQQRISHVQPHRTCRWIKPAIAVQAIFAFVENWNNYFIPALIINSNDKKTIPILIAQLRSADYLKFDLGKVYMMVFVAIIPVMIVYILLSKFIIKGVTMGSLKG